MTLWNLPSPKRDGFQTRVDAFYAYRVLPMIAALGWPDDVVEQWLFDHGRRHEFLRDYGATGAST